MKNSDAAVRRAAPAKGSAATKKRLNKRKAYIVCTVLAAIFILAAAIVLRGISDKRSYNDYMKQAQQSYSANDFDSALSELRKAAAIEKTDECLLLMADCYETQGNYTKALEVLRMMDVNNKTVSNRISAINARVQLLSEGEKLTIAGKQFKADTTSLVLDNMGLTDSVFDEIAQLYSLDNLSIASNSVSDISKLLNLGGLVTLNLSNNRIHDISPLASLTGLRTLYLDNNPITDLSPLYSLSNLTSLSIKGISITAAQLEELSRALPTCAIHSEAAKEEIQEISIGGVTFKCNVTELDLSGTGIYDISALSGCQELVKLNLSGNNISDLSPLMNIPNLTWLDISDNQVMDLRPLMGIKSLVYLNAANNTISSTSPFTMMSGLTTLYLDGNPIKDFSGLRKLKNVQTLGLSSTGLNDEGLSYMSSLGAMLTLNVENNPALTGEAVDTLAFTLGKCTINHSELSYVIDIDNHSVTTDTVELSMPGLGIVDITNISQLKTLENVDLSCNFISNIYPLMYTESRGTIKNLNLRSNGISDITPVSYLTAVETLDLSYNNIGSELALMNLFTLRKLVLTGNPLTEEQIDNLRSSLVNCEIVF